MSFSVVISSENYSGQVANIVYYPTTGGSINIGVHTIPYTYITNYYYGEYYIYFLGFSKVCNIILTPPTTTTTSTSTTTTTSSTTTTTTLPPIICDLEGYSFEING